MPLRTKKQLPLDPCDLAVVRNWGLTDETVRANGLHSVRDAMAIPFRDLDGNTNGYVGLRPHKPIGNLKYLVPKGEENRCYCPAESVRQVNELGTDVCLTEGFGGKPLGLAQHGITTLGTNGIWGWVKPKSQPKELNESFAKVNWSGRTVYLVFDFDEKATTRRTVATAEREFAAALIAAGAKQVLRVAIPAGPNGTKQGVDDFLVAHGVDAFRKLVAEAEPVGLPNDPAPNALNSMGKALGKAMGSNPTPTAFTRKLQEKLDAKALGTKALGSAAKGAGSMGNGSVRPFPVDALPGTLQRLVESAAAALPCPPDFIGAMILAVLGACIGRRASIEVKRGWVESALLWIAVIARSGDRKSPAYEIATAPLKAIQKALSVLFAKEITEYRAMSREERENISEPKLRQIVTTDTTVEALKTVLDVNPLGVIFTADEASGWVRSAGQYKGGAGDDRQIYLSLWTGTQIVSNRRGNPQPIIIDNPFMSLVGGLQPDVLGDFISEREDGLAARFLFAYPDPIPANDWTDDVIDNCLIYTSICQELFAMEPCKEPLKFSPEAKAVWIEWVNKHRKETPADNLRAMYSKAEGHCARISLILHLARTRCNETESADIDELSIAGAIRLLEYFKSHAARVYGHAAMASDSTKIAKALRWIRKQGGSVTARIARVNGFVRDTHEATELFQCLADLGHGTVTVGQQGSVTFTVNDNDLAGKEN